MKLTQVTKKINKARLVRSFMRLHLASDFSKIEYLIPKDLVYTPIYTRKFWSEDIFEESNGVVRISNGHRPEILRVPYLEFVDPKVLGSQDYEYRMNPILVYNYNKKPAGSYQVHDPDRKVLCINNEKFPDTVTDSMKDAFRKLILYRPFVPTDKDTEALARISKHLMGQSFYTFSRVAKEAGDTFPTDIGLYDEVITALAVDGVHTDFSDIAGFSDTHPNRLMRDFSSTLTPDNVSTRIRASESRQASIIENWIIDRGDSGDIDPSGIIGYDIILDTINNRGVADPGV